MNNCSKRYTAIDRMSWSCKAVFFNIRFIKLPTEYCINFEKLTNNNKITGRAKSREIKSVLKGSKEASKWASWHQQLERKTEEDSEPRLLHTHTHVNLACKGQEMQLNVESLCISVSGDGTFD